LYQQGARFSASGWSDYRSTIHATSSCLDEA
jgi:hypothetical protein